MGAGDVVITSSGRLGRIRLNRPEALNALTHAMVGTIAAALEAWAHDDSIETVLIEGAGDRGLCAGGDIVSIYRDARGDGTATAAFWRDEYALNALIAAYPKPYVALMDGIVLGGGVGISAHGSERIVTERTRIGMPEVGIGFAPDVGGTWLLSRAPGELGTHVALTGGLFTGADAVALGLADHMVPSARLGDFATALEHAAVVDVVGRFAVPVPASGLLAQRDWIDAAYSGDDAAAIVARLAGSSVEAARAAASTILTKSPTSIAVTLAALRRAATLTSLDDALDQEYRVGLRILEGTEIVEGIRAQVIDKDRQPRWSPATLAEVGSVEAYFAPLGERERRA
jgi:enoyl-CoA hydratase